MSEVLGVAAGAISIAGFAGHLAQSSAYLYNFFKDLKNAPEYIRSLSSELRVITSILITIEKSFIVQDTDLEQALKYCEQAINGLSDTIRNVEPALDLKKPQRLWKQFNAALKCSELAKRLSTLERAKTMLIQCCANATRDAQTGQVDMLHDLQRLLSSMSLGQSARTTTALETQRTIETINETTSNLNASCAQITEISSETCTIVKRAIDQTLDIRDMTRRIEATSKELVEETLSGRPKLVQALGKELERTISKSVQCYLREARLSRVNQTNRKYPPVNKLYIHDRESTRFISNTAPPRVGQRKVHSLQHHPDRPADCWIKKSSVGSRRHLIQNSLFGTISIGTTTTSYCRKSCEGLETDRKDVSHTIIILLPASWLFTTGATLSYKTWRLLGATQQPSPYCRLNTVNVVPWQSDVFIACRGHDLTAIRRLFDDGRASPFDVDEDGRNLLGFVAVGARFVRHDFRGAEFESEYFLCNVPDLYTKLLQRVENLFRVVDMLINLGVDASEMELHNQNPITILVSSWFEFVPDWGNRFHDSLSFLLGKLLASAKFDPFAGGNVLLEVDRSGECYALEFPNSYYSEVHPSAIDFLTKQNAWPLSWSPLQLQTLGKIPLSEPNDDDMDDARECVVFWVISTSEGVEKYLQAKLALLRKVLAHDGFLTLNLQHLIEDAIHSTVHHAAQVMALLSERDYYDQGPPLLPHRFEKRARVGAFLLTTLTLLLNVGRAHLADQSIIDRISQHAQSHDSPTFRIWKKAWREASRGLDTPPFNRSSTNTCLGSQTATSIDEQHEVEANNEGEWETESSNISEPSSEWETEEEWESGYMLDTAVDRSYLDDYIPSSRMNDYDEDYWSHLYPRIKQSNLDACNLDACNPDAQPSEGKFKRFAQAALSVVSSIV